MTKTPEKRTWVYIQRPREYEIALHGCGHDDPDWSEYKDHLWCPKCGVDFIPRHTGIFDGPILVRTFQLLGLRFDRFDLRTKKVEPFHNEAGGPVVEHGDANAKDIKG